jgi:hypothetical protein
MNLDLIMHACSLQQELLPPLVARRLDAHHDDSAQRDPHQR